MKREIFMWALIPRGEPKMPRPLNNIIKIRRLEFDVREIQEKLEFSEGSKGIGSLRKAMDARIMAITFLANAKRDYTWKKLMGKFHFGDSWKYK